MGATMSKSVCGVEFDLYMEEALPYKFPYDSTRPAGRGTGSLWAGRRMRVASSSPDRAWEEGSVAQLSQTNCGPAQGYTDWTVTALMADGATKQFQLASCDVTVGGLTASGSAIVFLDPPSPPAAIAWRNSSLIYGVVVPHLQLRQVYADMAMAELSTLAFTLLWSAINAFNRLAWETLGWPTARLEPAPEVGTLCRLMGLVRLPVCFAIACHAFRVVDANRNPAGYRFFFL
jgi:hypothetical protein